VTTALLPDSEPPEPSEHYSPNTEPRSRRHREVRAVTIAERRIGKRHLQLVAEELGDTSDLPPRPRSRAECKDGPRPCPFVSCQHHLYLDVGSKGSIKLNFPDLEPDQLEETCALDVAARGGLVLHEVARLMNVTRQRVQQIEEKVFRFLRQRSSGLRDYRGHAHDYDFAEPIAPQLPIISRALADARRAPPIVSPAPPVVSREEVPMPTCISDGCGKIVRPGKFKGTPAPGTEGMCRRCAKAHTRGAAPSRRKQNPAATEAFLAASNGAIEVRDLSVAALLEEHRLVEIVGIELLRAMAARIQNGGSGS
jgi:hypothetical protein